MQLQVERVRLSDVVAYLQAISQTLGETDAGVLMANLAVLCGFSWSTSDCHLMLSQTCRHVRKIGINVGACSFRQDIVMAVCGASWHARQKGKHNSTGTDTKHPSF